jgi:hypothetical protein
MITFALIFEIYAFCIWLTYAYKVYEWESPNNLLVYGHQGSFLYATGTHTTIWWLVLNFPCYANCEGKSNGTNILNCSNFILTSCVVFFLVLFCSNSCQLWPMVILPNVYIQFYSCRHLVVMIQILDHLEPIMLQLRVQIFLLILYKWEIPMLNS